MSQYFNLDFVPSQDPSLFQVLELPLPSPSSTATFNSIFSPETLLDTSSFQPVRQNGVPSLLDVPGPSSFQSRTTTIPLDKDVRNHDDCYKGVTRGRVRVTGGAHAPTVVPITSLVRLTQLTSSEISLNEKKKTVSSIVALGRNLPTQLDQGTTEEL